LRILQVHNHYQQAGGEDSVVESEGSMLAGAGHTVSTYELRNPTGRQAIATLAKAPWNRTAGRSVVEEAHRFGADVVHVHNTWFALSPAVFACLHEAGFPVVATIHNYRPACVNALLYRQGSACEDCVGKVPWRGVVRACYRGSRAQSAVVAATIQTARIRSVWHRDVDVVIALTDFAVGRLVASGIPEHRILVKPNVAADPGERTNAPSASRSVLFVGRMAEEKGVLDLVDAWNAVGVRLDLELVMIGDGPLQREVAERAGPGIHLAGRLDSAEVRRRMLSSRAVVIPSRWYEGLPMVLLEALAAGLPVVVPDHGPLHEASGEGGIIFRAGDQGALGRALSRLTASSRVDELGRRSRIRYETAYRPSSGLAALTRAYQMAIDGTHSGPKTQTEALE
jgi:glycosyltransferase involved in cell wall biosynthesis